MIYHEDKSSSVAFPVVVILLAMVAIVVRLALSSGHQTSARVWVPRSSGGLHIITLTGRRTRFWVFKGNRLRSHRAARI
jgi:integral membrane sensor domain MASE1